jgi:hypothetical protein
MPINDNKRQTEKNILEEVKRPRDRKQYKNNQEKTKNHVKNKKETIKTK